MGRISLGFLIILAVFLCAAWEEDKEPLPKKGFLLKDAGFSTPESVLYDAEADLYLIANINGSPTAKDGNGFISRVSPAGKVIALKWIDGKKEGVTLNGPKGMALTSKYLYVSDIDAVRIFDRSSGTPVNETVIQDARFINDVAAADDGTVYVTDSRAGVIYSIDPKGKLEKLAQGDHLKNPNGIAVRDDKIRVAGFASNTIFSVDKKGKVTAKQEVPGGGLDGLAWLEDGTLLVSSWQASAVYLIDPSGSVEVLFSGITAPADIGFDTKRGLVLIPHFKDHRVEARPLKH